jgi:hypothetical protein
MRFAFPPYVLMALMAPVLLTKPASAAQTELLSIRNLHIGADEYVDEFKIDTWGAEILAVCHIPPAWEVRADNDFPE